MKTKNDVRNKRASRGRWSKGASGNPAGRPAGSRNKTTLLLEALLEGEGEKLTRKAIEKALEGDSLALRLCLERLLPPRRDRLINMSLPPIKKVRHVVQAFAEVTAAIAEGQITPCEGEQVAGILEIQRQIIESAEESEDFETRLAEIESLLKPGDKS